MPGRQRDNDDRAAASTNLGCANHGVWSVVAALYDYVRLKYTHELERCVLLEDGNGIDRFECRQHVCTLSFRSDGSVGTLEALYGSVAIQANDENITARAGTEQNVDVTGVKEIENAVGKNDPPALLPAPVCERFPRHDLSLRITAAQYVHSA